MTTYTPDAWTIFKVNDTYKVLSGWYGGYTGSDSWRANSGIKSIKENTDYYEVHGYSGSVYICYKGIERMTGLMSDMYSSWIKLIQEDNAANNTCMKMSIVPMSECIEALKQN